MIPVGTLFLLEARDDRVISGELALRTIFGRVSDAEEGDPDKGWGPELRECLVRLESYGADRRLDLGWRWLGVVRVLARLGG